MVVHYQGIYFYLAYFTHAPANVLIYPCLHLYFPATRRRIFSCCTQTPLCPTFRHWHHYVHTHSESKQPYISLITHRQVASYTCLSNHRNICLFNNHTTIQFLFFISISTISHYSPSCNTQTNNYTAWFQSFTQDTFFTAENTEHMLQTPWISTRHHGISFTPTTPTHFPLLSDNPFRHQLFMLSPTQLLCLPMSHSFPDNLLFLPTPYHVLMYLLAR